MRGRPVKNAKTEVITDVRKSIAENLQEHMNYWNGIRKQVDDSRSEIKAMQCKLESLPDVPENRSLKADLRVKIQDEIERINVILNEHDEIDYIGCIAKVVKEATEKRNDPNRTIEFDKETHQEVRVISATGPMRPRMKKKKLNQVKSNTVITKSIASFVSEMDDVSEGESLEECKRLAQLTHEIPMDQIDFEYCPSCPGKVILEFVEKPPSVCCPKCGLCKETIDINSSAVHDKETSVHIPFTYRYLCMDNMNVQKDRNNTLKHGLVALLAKLGFLLIIQKLAYFVRYEIPKDILASIYLELDNMRINEDVNAVTWDVVDRIVRKLAKGANNKKFNIYYQHVYQITNIIRGAAILTLTPSQDLLDMFDVIYESWERNKDPDRSNFMSNAFVLQMCFSILGYPEKVIGMFNMLKGSENLRDYDRICKLICDENGWNWEKVQSSVLANVKYVGSSQNILDLIPGESEGEDNPFEDFNPFEEPLPDVSSKKKKTSEPTLSPAKKQAVDITPIRVSNTNPIEEPHPDVSGGKRKTSEPTPAKKQAVNTPNIDTHGGAGGVINQNKSLKRRVPDSALTSPHPDVPSKKRKTSEPTPTKKQATKGTKNTKFSPPPPLFSIFNVMD